MIINSKIMIMRKTLRSDSCTTVPKSESSTQQDSSFREMLNSAANEFGRGTGMLFNFDFGYDWGAQGKEAIGSGRYAFGAASFLAAGVEGTVDGALAYYLGKAIYGRLSSIGAGGVQGVKGGNLVDDLTGTVKSNYNRFVKSVPANSKGGVTAQLLDDGSYLFSTSSPGKVPGSSALYQKWVNAQGITTKFLKTTFDPKGNIVHIKDKINGTIIQGGQ